MTISTRTTQEVYDLCGALENALRATQVYLGASRNGALVPRADAFLGTLAPLVAAATGGTTPPVDDGGFPFAARALHLRFDAAGSALVVDEVAGPGVWSLVGGAAQTAPAIAGPASLDLLDNPDGLKYALSTHEAVSAALAFDGTADWCIRFKYAPGAWPAFYAAILGSGPGNPVLTFREDGRWLAVAGADARTGDEPPEPGVPQEYLVGYTAEGRLIRFFAGGRLLNPGGTFYDTTWAPQSEWRIGTQSHAPECLDGKLDDLQVFRGFAGPTADYVPQPTSIPFPKP